MNKVKCSVFNKTIFHAYLMAMEYILKNNLFIDIRNVGLACRHSGYELTIHIADLVLCTSSAI